jgi:PleD family two-component response regulator
VEAKRQTLERAGFGVSIGIDIAPLRDAAFEVMYRRADQALYRAKGAGRNRYVISDVAQALA